eukprot:CAMPEP_0202892894 /NCGR_PEP_ID=MMETSP1392-20130828/2573_1 /ASSEMBLY_ACC=CAM_ASM_000868 /TAXON_ID=225041 /ORGANISM="Chlamydomonas chlamydogama, Strain SAG 11-48b" /LENGTH=245 /DNA_ID=CAMNT_0049577027 /DNA_START=392 /DNA_END=1130 /DNA_ORIENTATION=-
MPMPPAWLSQGMAHAQGFAQQVGMTFQGILSHIPKFTPSNTPQHAQSNKSKLPMHRPMTFASISSRSTATASPSSTIAKPASSIAATDSTLEDTSLGLELAAATGAVVARGATSKEDLGRATWTLLHTLAAQLPDQPSRQQQQDVKALINILTRIYPCGDCAKHFKEIVRRDPPVVRSGPKFQQWLCRVHNVVNRSIGKPEFNCGVVGARWSPLDCGAEGAEQAGSVCDMKLEAAGGDRRALRWR